MNALVVYDSQYGNTERVALSIADTLRSYGQVRAVRVGAAQAVELQGVDLLIVGSPTQAWKATPATQSFLKRLTPAQLRGMAVASFDTRYHKPRWLTGSAAETIAKALRSLRISPVVPPESFFVDGQEGPLEIGELDRAATWAQTLAKQVGAQQPAML